MRISLKQLKKLPVKTLSGTELGHINDIIFDVDTQQAIQYSVKHGIGKTPLLISKDQISSITETDIVVYDTAIPRVVPKIESQVSELEGEPA